MLFRGIEKEFEYILWLRERIKKLNFGITRRVKTDSTEDFKLLTHKLKTYRQEFSLVLDELYSLLKEDDLQTQTDNLREESGAIPIRSPYCEWLEKKEEDGYQATKQRTNNGRRKIQRRLGF